MTWVKTSPTRHETFFQIKSSQRNLKISIQVDVTTPNNANKS